LEVLRMIRIRTRMLLSLETIVCLIHLTDKYRTLNAY